MSKTVGVIGGMGPYATADYFRKVLDLTEAASDQEHIHIIIDDNTEIPDRTNYIIGEGEDPSAELVATALRLRRAGAELLVMPCNTAHFFYEKIKSTVDIPFINMIEEVAKSIRATYGEGAKAGLFATLGTYTGEMYEKEFARYGMDLIVPDKAGMQHVYEYICNIKRGDYENGLYGVSGEAEKFRDKGARAIILGCTELPLIVEKLPGALDYIDSTKVLAQRTVSYAKEEEDPKGMA